MAPGEHTETWVPPPAQRTPPAQTGWQRGRMIWALASGARIHVEFLSFYGLQEADQVTYFF